MPSIHVWPPHDAHNAYIRYVARDIQRWWRERGLKGQEDKAMAAIPDPTTDQSPNVYLDSLQHERGNL